MRNFNAMELMICVAARELGNGYSAAVGAGAPCAAAMLAQRTLAPHLIMLFESGGVDPAPPEMPVSAGDSRTIHRAVLAGGMAEIMQMCSLGWVDYAILGGAQIDMYGNINTTMLGWDFAKPSIRLPGSGGSNDFASLCWRTIIMSVQEKTRFPKKLDFLTTPGWLEGGDSRVCAGLPPGSGPYRVITNMGVMDFDSKTRRMRVISANPGFTFDDIQKNCEFELLKAPKVFVTKPPTATELKILREEIDPHRLIIGR